MILKDSTCLTRILPDRGRLIALDVGRKRIGLASCDDTRLITTPRAILTRQSNQKDFARIKNFFEEYKAVAIVVGLPLNMDGSDSIMSQFVEKFSENLDLALDGKIPIFLADERLTSFEAREILSTSFSNKKNKFCDDIAAQVILSSFLATFLTKQK